MIEEPKINRNLALELLRVTEAGALAAAPLQGRDDKGEAEGLPVQELTVVVLDRDRNKETIAQIREVGARIKLISAGDVAGALEAALETRFGIHCMMGSGGATEGVLAACALKTIGGDMQAKLYFKDKEERELALNEGHQPDRVLCLDDLC